MSLRDVTNVAGGSLLGFGLQGFGKVKQALCEGKTSERGAEGAGVGPYGCGAPRAEAPTSLPLARAQLDIHWGPLPTLSPAAHFVGEAANPQTVAEYAGEILNHLFHEEANYLPRQNYMRSQADINSKMRSILIDWLAELHMKYHLRSETLFLAVNILDRFLGQRSIAHKRLQLIGVVAMFIAAKFEEITPPEMYDFLYMTDNAYSTKDMLAMECTVLTTLGFNIVVPTAANFVDFLQKVNKCDEAHKCLSQYILELALLDIRMIRFAPSHLASAALLLSNEMIQRQPAWPPAMCFHSRHTEQALRECVEILHALLEAAPSSDYQAIYKKFSKSQYSSVAKLSLA